MTDNVTFRPKRKMDRLLIMLFFVNFVISLALCWLVSSTLNQLKELSEITCEGRTGMTVASPICDGQEG